MMGNKREDVPWLQEVYLEVFLALLRAHPDAPLEGLRADAERVALRAVKDAEDFEDALRRV